MQAFAATHIQDVRIRGRDRNGADGLCGLLVKDWLPGPPGIVRLPDTAIDGANVKDVRVRWHAGHSACTAAAERPDHSPLQGSGELFGRMWIRCVAGR